MMLGQADGKWNFFVGLVFTSLVDCLEAVREAVRATDVVVTADLDPDRVHAVGSSRH